MDLRFGVRGMVSSKQTNMIFGSNRNKPKQDLFRVCFGLSWKNKQFRFVKFVSVWTYIETTETNRTVSKQTETTLNFLKNAKMYSLSNSFGWSSVCFVSNETLKLSVFAIEPKQPKQTVSKQTKTNRNNPIFCEKNTKICSLSHCFSVAHLFVSQETPKLSVSV